MDLKVSSIPTLPRVNGGLARLLPVATTLLAAVIAILPVRVPGYAALVPAFTLMAVYHWTIYRPDLLPPLWVFAIGLAQDLLSGALIGVGALVLLLARSAMFGLWVLHCVLQLNLFDLRSTVFRTALTVAMFPLASFALGRTQRALMGA